MKPNKKQIENLENSVAYSTKWMYIDEEIYLNIRILEEALNHRNIGTKLLRVQDAINWLKELWK